MNGLCNKNKDDASKGNEHYMNNLHQLAMPVIILFHHCYAINDENTYED